MTNLLQDFLCIGAILSGILVITSRNPVISVLFLISVFVNVAGYLVLLGLGFIGLSYLIVYVGAIAILFLFVVMMLNLQLAELSPAGREYTQNLPLGTILSSLFLIEFREIIAKLPSGNEFSSDPTKFNLNFLEILQEIQIGNVNWFNSKLFLDNPNFIKTDIHIAFNSVQPDQNFQSFLEIQSIGNLLYTNGIVWLILCSVILLLAIIGPITLSINKQLQYFARAYPILYKKQ